MRILSSLLLASVLSVVACSRPDDQSPSKSTLETTFVNGNPMEMIEGARLNKRSPFNARNIESLKGYGLIMARLFQEREKQETKIKSKQEVEHDNRPSEKPRSEAFQNIQDVHVERGANDSWTVGLLQDSLKLEFKSDAEGNLQPVSAGAPGGEKYRTRILHWSQTADGKALSFLLSFYDAKVGTVLFSVYLERKSPPVEQRRINTRFLTLDGPGSGTRWTTPQLKIQLCGAQELLADTRLAVNQWQGALGNRLRLNFEATSEYAPFSDLNQHCIHLLRKMRSQTAGGFAATTISPFRKSIIDSDIFIYGTANRELQESYADRSQGIAVAQFYRRYALVHEMGHMLGLDHQFTGVASIMSYSFTTQTLTAYDREAIQALYDLNAAK